MAAFLSIIIVAQPAICCAQPKGRSVAVQPVLDGDSDDASREIAQALGDALRTSTPHHVVDSDTAANIVGYQDAAHAAASDVQEASSLIHSAKERYFNFRYKEAGEDLDRAISMLEGSGAVESAPLLLDAYISRALIANSSKDRDGAVAALGRAIEIDPLLVLMREDYPPSLVELFDEAKAAGASTPRGSLFVHSLPEGASVLVNGIDHGAAPVLLEGLPSGSYSLVVRANRYRPEARTVAIAPGEKTDVKVKLGWAKADRSERKEEADFEAAALVREGVRIAEALKVDRAVLVDADLGDGESLDVIARTVDRPLRAGQRPLAVKGVNSEQRDDLLARMASGLADQIEADVAKDPAGYLDPVGQGDPKLLGRRKKPLTKQPLFWGAVGAVAAGAIVGGVIAAMSSGPSHGSIKVSFK